MIIEQGVFCHFKMESGEPRKGWVKSTYLKDDEMHADVSLIDGGDVLHVPVRVIKPLISIVGY